MSPPRLLSTAPVLPVADVGATAQWYAQHLGFKVSVHPETPPHAFGMACRDGVELMFRCVRSARPSGDWDVYVRMRGVADLHSDLQSRGVAIVEPLRTKDYGQTEFAIEDLNGTRIVFSEGDDGPRE